MMRPMGASPISYNEIIAGAIRKGGVMHSMKARLRRPAWRNGRKRTLPRFAAFPALFRRGNVVASRALRSFPALRFVLHSIAKAFQATVAQRLPFGRPQAEWHLDNRLGQRYTALVHQSAFSYPVRQAARRLRVLIPIMRRCRKNMLPCEALRR